MIRILFWSSHVGLHSLGGRRRLAVSCSVVLRATFYRSFLPCDAISIYSRTLKFCMNTSVSETTFPSPDSHFTCFSSLLLGQHSSTSSLRMTLMSLSSEVLIFYIIVGSVIGGGILAEEPFHEGEQECPPYFEKWLHVLNPRVQYCSPQFCSRDSLEGNETIYNGGSRRKFRAVCSSWGVLFTASGESTCTWENSMIIFLPHAILKPSGSRRPSASLRTTPRRKSSTLKDIWVRQLNSSNQSWRSNLSCWNAISLNWDQSL